jgi:carboxymethylenebutenolidase
VSETPVSLETIDIAAADGVADALLARPEGGSNRGVLFVIDAFGLRPTITEMVERIARGGYVVLAPNVLYRAGRSPLVSPDELADPEGRSAAFTRLRPHIMSLGRERVAADGAAYLDALADAGAEGPVAVTGYCMGGRVGWWLAATHPDRVAALAAFHTGGLVTDADESPHRAAGDVRAELLFGFADEDASMTREQIATFEQTLREAGLRATVDVYEGARHGYTMADQPVFDEAARERHYAELGALLERTLP